MSEETLRKSTESLLNLSLKSFVRDLKYSVNSQTVINFQKTRFLPPRILIDVYLKISEERGLRRLLYGELSNLEFFGRLVRQTSIRQDLFKCVCRLPWGGKYLALSLQAKFIAKYTIASKSKDSSTSDSPESKNSPKTFTDDFDIEAVQLGLNLGSFLFDAGWWIQSNAILACVSDRLEDSPPEHSTLLLRLDCFQRLLRAEAGLCNFNSADRYFKGIQQILTILGPEKIPTDLLALIYTQMSAFYYARSEYTQSLKYGTMALSQIKEDTPPKILVDVLRQTGRACVVKCQFKRAFLLITEALKQVKEFFGRFHPKYFDVLIDCGFYLWNVDAIVESIHIFEAAHSLDVEIFGRQHFQTAVVHENLSYAYYIYEYPLSNFSRASHHVELSISILEKLMPKNHMILASSKRIKGLILERCHIMNVNEGLLDECEALYKFGLQHSLDAFGEMNVHTARLYRNLGRLYRSMNKYEKAEELHLKAVAIMSELLGPYDYEVGLSLGHLASLYNYSMSQYREAEQLYLRNIKISHHHFGESFSGLIYSYNGLCDIYKSLGEQDKLTEYRHIIANWENLREQKNFNGFHLIQMIMYPENILKLSIDELIKMFNALEPEATISEDIEDKIQ